MKVLNTFLVLLEKVFFSSLCFLNTVLYKCNMDLTKIRQWIVCLLMGLIFLGDAGYLKP